MQRPAAQLHRMALHPAVGCSGIIVAVTAAYLVCGVGAFLGWRITSNDAWVTEFFRVPASVAMLWLSAMQLWLAAEASRQFAAGEMLRSAWRWMTLSAAFDFAGAIASQILSVKSRLNPLLLIPGWSSPDALSLWRDAGGITGGPLRFGCMAIGLWYVVRVYRRAGFLARLKVGDMALLAGFLAYLATVVYDVVVAFGNGKPWKWAEAAQWPTDPLLFLLLLEGLILYRSTQRMGRGWIGRCWKTLSIAAFLTALGDVGTWAFNYGYVRWPWNSAIWYVWLPAAAAYALAPAYQLEAIHHALTGGERPPRTAR